MERKENEAAAEQVRHDVFGSNAFIVIVGLIFFVDLAYRPGPIFEATGSAVIIAIVGCVIMTAVSLAGMIEREDYTIFGMGVDSTIVLILYMSGLAVIYLQR